MGERNTPQRSTETLLPSARRSRGREKRERTEMTQFQGFLFIRSKSKPGRGEQWAFVIFRVITPALYTNTKAIIEKQREFIETEAKESEMEKGDRKGENCRRFRKKPE